MFSDLDLCIFQEERTFLNFEKKIEEMFPWCYMIYATCSNFLLHYIMLTVCIDVLETRNTALYMLNDLNMLNIYQCVCSTFLQNFLVILNIVTTVTRPQNVNQL